MRASVEGASIASIKDARFEILLRFPQHKFNASRVKIFQCFSLVPLFCLKNWIKSEKITHKFLTFSLKSSHPTCLPFKSSNSDSSHEYAAVIKPKIFFMCNSNNLQKLNILHRADWHSSDLFLSWRKRCYKKFRNISFLRTSFEGNLLRKKVHMMRKLLMHFHNINVNECHSEMISSQSENSWH